MPKRMKDTEQLYRSLYLTQSEVKRLFELAEDEASQIYKAAYRNENREKQDGMVLFHNKVKRSYVLKTMGITEDDFDRFIQRKNRSELLRTERSRVGGQNDLPNSNKKRKR